MNDNRVKWMQNVLFTGLGLKDEVLFRELLERNERENEKQLLELLDKPTSNPVYSSALIFYSKVSQVEREIEIEEGNQNYLRNHT